MKILFIGCVESSEALLSTLIENRFNICGVVTKSESAINADFVNLSELCVVNSIPVHFYKTGKYSEYIDFISGCNPDIIYCFGWSHILKEDVLNIPPLGTVGFHPTELPRNRGRHPIIWAIVLGLKQTASTFFIIEAGIDDGDIISQEIIAINEIDNARTLSNKIYSAAKLQIVSFTKQFQDGTIKYISQDEAQSSVWRKRVEKDGLIDFRMRAETICRLIRALGCPYVGAHFEYNGIAYKVWKAEALKCNKDYENIEYGKVLKIYSERSFLVKADNSLLKILDCENVQLREGDYL